MNGDGVKVPATHVVLMDIADCGFRGISWAALERMHGPEVRPTIDHLVGLRLVVWQKTAAHTDMPNDKELRVYASTEKGTYPVTARPRRDA